MEEVFGITFGDYIPGGFLVLLAVVADILMHIGNSEMTS
jgi:hypothetical protein